MVSDAAKRKQAAKKAAGAAKRAQHGAQPPAATPAAACSAPVQVLFPAALTPRQRAVLHQLAAEAGLRHESTGDGGDRRITLGPADAAVVDLSADGVTSDEALCQLLQQHLALQAQAAFEAPPADASRQTARGNGATPPASDGTSHRFAQHGTAKASSGAALSLEAFLAATLPLLELERAAEVAAAQDAVAAGSPEAAAARGRALLNLRCTDAEGGLLGRTLLTLRSNKGGGAVDFPLPPHSFSPHDVVQLRAAKAEAGAPVLASGVVYRVRDDLIIVAVDEAPEEGLDAPLRLEKLANEVTYKRLKETLGSMARGAAPGRPGARLLDVLFGRASPRFQPSPPAWTPVNAGLDASQRRAVARCLAAQDVALIHGPPGTGKTTAVVEVILQEAARGNRVLAAAASNIAVDNLVERLAAAAPKLALLRLGHPARLLPSVLGASLEAAVLRSDSSALAADCRAEIRAANRRLLRLGRKDYAERRALRGELRALAKEERKRQERAVAEVVKGARVVCCTLTGVLSHNMAGQTFDVAVVDEAAQALEAATWSALLLAPRACLAGDHLQLPPTVVSEEAMRKGYGRTLFERLQELYGDSISEMLTVQYRMHADIMQWSSSELYGGRLTAHPSVAAHRLHDLPPGIPGLAEVEPLVLIDTAGCDMEEQAAAEGDSKRNPGEAQVVMAHVQRLVAAGLRPGDVGVITPYAGQVALLRELRPAALAALEISTVDGFQGREKEAVVISMVRSNAAGEVGFLAERRRMNVAVTRARRHCAIVCDSETVGRDAFLGRLVAYCEAHGAYVSAQELVPP